MVIKINPLNDNRWDDFVFRHPEGSIYHTSAWIDVLCRTYRYSVCCFVMEDENYNLTAGILLMEVSSRITGKRLVSLPFSDHCNLLIQSENDRSLLIAEVLHYAEEKKAASIEIRTLNDQGRISPFNRKNAFNFNHILDISASYQSIKTGFHKSLIKRNIKKAENTNLTVNKSTGNSQISRFYDLYVLTRKKHGLPPQPFSFFRNISKIKDKNINIQLYLADDDGISVAGILTAVYKETMYYLYGGSNPRALDKRPNHLLISRAIMDACGQNLHFFDFGRTSLDNSGLIQFKKAWGAGEKEVCQYKYSRNNRSSELINRRTETGRLGHFILKNTPVFFLKKIGVIIYRHLG